MKRPVKFSTAVRKLNESLGDSRACLIGEKLQYNGSWYWEGLHANNSAVNRLDRLETKAFDLLAQLENLVQKRDALVQKILSK